MKRIRPCISSINRHLPVPLRLVLVKPMYKSCLRPVEIPTPSTRPRYRVLPLVKRRSEKARIGWCWDFVQGCRARGAWVVDGGSRGPARGRSHRGVVVERVARRYRRESFTAGEARGYEYGRGRRPGGEGRAPSGGCVAGVRTFERARIFLLLRLRRRTL